MMHTYNQGSNPVWRHVRHRLWKSDAHLSTHRKPLPLPSFPTLPYRRYSWVQMESSHRATANLSHKSAWWYWFECPPATVETHVLEGWSPANDAILDCSRNFRSYTFIGGSRPLKVCRHTLASSCLLLLPLHSEAGKILCHAHLPPWCSGQVSMNHIPGNHEPN